MRRLRCFLGFHFWIGHMPYGLTRQGPLCNRTCKFCPAESYGLGYHEADTSWITPVVGRPSPGGPPPLLPPA